MIVLVQGMELELYTNDKVGLLSDVTRIFRENGLCIRRAEISTKGGKAKDTFLVTDVLGKPLEQKIVDLVRDQIGQTALKVKDHPLGMSPKRPHQRARSFLFGNFLKG